MATNQATNYIPYEPFLTNKHENTPIFDYENPILSYFDLHYLKDKLMIDKDGNILPGNISINSNEINISPNKYMLYNKEYKIEIVKESIIDSDENNLELDYSYEFTPEGPRTNLENNEEIDILDIAMLANKYNLTSKDDKWNSLYDFNGDKVIDIFDLVLLSKKIKS